ESGGTALFTVVLNTQPTADVTIALSSNDTTEGTLSTSSLIFTAANWNVAQSVTVTGVDDAIVDGNVGYTILTAAATSTDSVYNGLNAADVSLTNTDNDTAGITVNGTSAKDILTGTVGPDIITGFQGPDILTGKGGSDRFVYTSIVDGGDTITDFSASEGDIVDLTRALKSISYMGSNPIADGYLKFLQIGNSTMMQIDPDGSGAAIARNFILFNQVNASILSSTTNFLF
ncbi:MAG: type I secretion C-terminal target domain-containing protein, partial [Cyanobacteria bacterium]|nr:type I secretion C-terminal target domain-containing protein [Cyanobacteriota bacterium]